MPLPHAVQGAVIKFAPASGFDYELPTVGVLPSLPVIDGSLDNDTLRGLGERVCRAWVWCVECPC
jgi:hypothetical protein